MFFMPGIQLIGVSSVPSSLKVSSVTRERQIYVLRKLGSIDSKYEQQKLFPLSNFHACLRAILPYLYRHVIPTIVILRSCLMSSFIITNHMVQPILLNYDHPVSSTKETNIAKVPLKGMIPLLMSSVKVRYPIKPQAEAVQS